MKLRDKKTGEILETGEHVATVWKKMGYCDHYSYNSLAELNENWEVYNPIEPLIKDEKARKAVRSWYGINFTSKTNIPRRFFNFIYRSFSTIRGYKKILFCESSQS